MNWLPGHPLQAGKYRITRHIGGGGFGLTYLAEDTALQRQVVIKVPNPTFQADQDYEQFVRRFQREGQALAKINHPNVVQVIELCQEAGVPCLVMAYVEGETLNQRIRHQGRIPQDEALPIFRKLATVLHYLHQQQIIHCDLHPGNIILRPNGEPVLIDFGSVKLLQPSTHSVTTTVNEAFSPYEQGRQGNDPNPGWDVYALAATLYFVVTGQKPEAAVIRKLYGDTLKPPQTFQSDLRDWLNQAIVQGMALEAADRPSSMQTWLANLQPPLSPKPPELKKAPPKPATPPSPTSKNPTSTQSTVAFPRGALSCLALGYLPIGVILGLSNVSTGAMAWVLAWAMAWVLAWAWAWALALAGVLAWAVSVAWAMAWAGALAVALAGAVAGFVAVAVAGIVAVAVALAGAEAGAEVGDEVVAWAFVWAFAGTLLGGAIASYGGGIGIWSGLGMALLGCIQFLLILVGISVAEKPLTECYHLATVFGILGGFSSLGLALGGGLGWCLWAVGVRLPG